MKPEWRRFAPIGLFISLAAALVSLGLYIVQREFSLYLQVGLALVVVGLALFAALDPDRVRKALTGRQARYGSNALVLTLAFLGILVVVNYFVYGNSKRWDLTEDKQNTLTQETLDTMAALPEPVTALAFFSPQRSSGYAQSLLDDYKFYSDGKLDYKFIDPLSNPQAIQEAQVNKDGTIVFRMGDRQEQATSVTEREFTGALVRLMSGQEHVVYFLSGHGEYSPDETGDQSYALARTTLESKNYTVQTLNLLSSNRVPEDASLIVIAGPLHSLIQAEVDLLSAYLDGGGAVMLLSEPPVLTEFSDDAEADLLGVYLSENWGITLGEDVIVDTTSTQPLFAYAAEYGDHLITQRMQRVGTAFPTARSLQMNTDSENAFATQLVLTAAQSWAETNLEAVQTGGKIAPDEGVDRFGPLVIAAVAEASGGEGRLVVFGDSDFAADVNFTYLGNGDMFVNSVDWAVGQEELINLTPRNPTQRIMLPPQPYMMNLILLGVVFVLPGTVLASGIVVWARRKRRG